MELFCLSGHILSVGCWVSNDRVGNDVMNGLCNLPNLLPVVTPQFHKLVATVKPQHDRELLNRDRGKFGTGSFRWAETGGELPQAISASGKAKPF